MMKLALLACLTLGVAGAPSAPGDPGHPSHFPDRLHALVFRNWTLVPTDRIARVVGAKPEEILALGKSMGLPDPPAVSGDQWRRSYITILRRNWHLLPREQILDLLGWTSERLDFTLREDDFLEIKLGNSKPRCDPIRYTPPDGPSLAREKAIAGILREEFPGGAGLSTDPLFSFVKDLAAPLDPARPRESRFSPRFCYSYFALYGDPLLDPEADPYPDGYLERLSRAGVDGVWIQGLLSKLSPFPWEPGRSEAHPQRRQALRALVERARKHGIGVYLYLNEPRALPLEWFRGHPGLRGVVEGDYAALCTSAPEVARYLVDSVASLLKEVPDLAGLFTITASENLTNCWSHGRGGGCDRCTGRMASEVIAEVHSLIRDGIVKSGSRTKLIAWDWGWKDPDAPEIIRRLPAETCFMSVSEWGVPIDRGGVKGAIGEYSISAIGPGPRATRHWELAKRRGLPTIAKIQAGNTWELSSVPWIPAVENVARHAESLRRAGVDGLMLGWTLGGYPSPNLEVVAEIGASPDLSAEQAMERVARRRYGEAAAPAVVRAWRDSSAAFREFPFHVSTVYRAPLQFGPSNLLWESRTGLVSTMIGFPYDHLDGWRADYPAEIFIAQMAKVAEGFERAALELGDAAPEERRIMEASAIHFRSTAIQSRFVLARDRLSESKTEGESRPWVAELEKTLREEIGLARRLHALQAADARIGFEASNQYYYVPVDLAEKVLNARDLLDRWLPSQRR